MDGTNMEEDKSLKHWEIESRLTKRELELKLRELNLRYQCRRYKHKKGDTYMIDSFSILSHKGIGEYAVNYFSIGSDGLVDYNIPHTRPAREFFQETRFREES